MKTDIKVTFEAAELEAMCVKAYTDKFGPAPEGMECVATMLPYSSKCTVELFEKEKEPKPTPVPDIVQENETQASPDLSPF